MMVGIVNSRQNSPVDFFLGLVDKFDHPTGRTNAQGWDFDNSLSTKIIGRKLSKLLTHVPNRSDEKGEFVNIDNSLNKYLNVFFFAAHPIKRGDAIMS